MAILKVGRNWTESRRSMQDGESAEAVADQAEVIARHQE
jgi:hypothetical protein